MNSRGIMVEFLGDEVARFYGIKDEQEFENIKEGIKGMSEVNFIHLNNPLRIINFRNVTSLRFVEGGE